MDGLSSGGVSDEETQASMMPRIGYMKSGTKSIGLFLPSGSCTPPEEEDDFWDEAWSVSDRTGARQYWDGVSPVRRTRANSSNSACWSPEDQCRPSSLSFVPGESARYTSTPETFSTLARPRPAVSSSTRIVPHDLCQGEFDSQGIPWSRFSISRSDYRAKRIREYSNYNNVNWTARLELQRRREIDAGVVLNNSTWNFLETFKSVNPTIDHFQLRHLLCSTSNQTSYYVSNSTLYALNKQTLVSRRVLAGNPQQLACMAVGHGLAATGAFDSELVVGRADGASEVFRGKMSLLENSITNHVEFAGPQRLLVANNDQNVTEIDLAVGQPSTKFKWHSAVNHVSSSSSLMCLAGDTCEASLIDRREKTVAITLTGHLDYLFCSSWKDEQIVCTGSQDGTCRLWDIRKPELPFVTLGTLLGAVRSAKFSPNKRFLCFSEPADIVHVYETSSFKECQILDFFGNIGGIAFSPDSSKLSVAVADTMFGCIADFQLNTLPINTFKQP